MPAASHMDLNRVLSFMHSRLIVRQLQSVLKRHGQPASGLKGVLQERLKAYIHQVYQSGNSAKFEALKNDIMNPDRALSTSPAAHTHSNGPAVGGLPPVMGGSTGTFVGSFGAGTAAVGPRQPSTLHFSDSPFYTVLTRLSDTVILPTLTSNRHSVKTIVALQEDQVVGIRDGKYKVMLYCATIDNRPVGSKSEVAFPHQSEISVNNKIVTGLNLRGLKNKPGTTRPADITNSLTLKTHYRNEVMVTYAMTQKDFAFQVSLVKAASVESLVDELKNGDVIAKQTVIDDLVRKNQDPDLVATSQVMSLKCPISTLRIEVPVRSRHCKHMQCYDATSFLQLQQQAPTWNCPTCNHTVFFKQLAVDKYFDDILSNTPKTVESVTIDPDGKWSVATESSNSPDPDESDDEFAGKDIVSLDDSPQPPRRTSAPNNVATPKASTPASSSVRPGTTSAKRPIAQVIDLTLSDDDEPPATRTKRTHINFPTPSSLPGTSGSFYGSSGRSTPAATSTAGSQFSPVGTPDPFTLPPLQRPQNQGWWDRQGF